MHALTAGLFVDALSGALMVVLGALVAWKAGWAPGHRSFVVFALAFGAAFIVPNLTTNAGHFPVGGRVAFGCLLILAAVALLRLVTTYPEPVSRAGAGTRAIALMAALVPGMFWYVPLLVPMPALNDVLVRVGFSLLFGVNWGALVLFALRYGQVSTGVARSRYALMSLALVPYPLFFLGNSLGVEGVVSSQGFLGLASALILLFLLSGSWTWSLRSVQRPGAARWIHVFALALALSAMLLGGQAGAAGEWGGLGLSRTFMVAVLAYAILQHQLFGIDVKVKWTLKQSTVAAVFIGLFFVVSEAAAAFFSEQVGTYLGIVAAGALVFAIAPLQHFAQRVADRAMPGVKGAGEMLPDERAAFYLNQARTAWANGSLSSDERELLNAARDYLGLDPADAIRIEEEARTAVLREASQ